MTWRTEKWDSELIIERISDISFTQVVPVGATKGQRGRNRKRRRGKGNLTGFIWDSTEQSIPVFS